MREGPQPGGGKNRAKAGYIHADELAQENESLRQALAECRRREESLHRSVERYRRETEELALIYRTAPVGLAVCDRKLRYRHVNERWVELTGAPVADHTGEALISLLPATVHDWALQVARAVLEKGDPVIDAEIRIKDSQRTEEQLCWNSHWRPLRDEAGQVWGLTVALEDITERDRLARELRSRAAVTENSGNFIALYSDEKRPLFLNEAGRKMVGLDTDQDIGSTSLLDCVWPDDRKLIEQQAMPALRREGRWSGTVRLQNFLTHEPIYTQWLAFAIEDVAGRRPVWATVGTNVDNLMRAQAALHESEEALRVVIDSTYDGIIVHTPQGKILSVNQTAKKMYGLSDEQAQQLRVTDISAPSMRAASLRFVWSKVLSGEAQFFEWKAKQPGTGVEFDVEVYLCPIRRGGKDVILANIRDITDRKRTEQVLRESREDLNRAQAVASTGSWRLDARHNKLLWSDEVYRLFGIVCGTPLTYEDFLDHIHPDDRDRVDRAWKNALQGAPYDIEHRIVVEDRVKWLRECVELEFSDRGELLGGFGTAQDITERKEYEQSLLRSNEELTRLNAELEEFAYVASHDLKAPLRAVANLAYWIDEDATAQLDDENRNRLRLLRERIIRMDRLIEGLLAYARLDRIGSSERQNVSLETLLPELLETMAIPKGFQVLLVEPLPALTANPAQLRQIFQNLIRNAFEHHDCPFEGHLRISADDSGDYWRVELADDGPGIPPGERERIFKMFATTAGEGHAGIGLAVVRKLILAHGGQITVTANTPRGARFEILWPKEGSSSPVPTV